DVRRVRPGLDRHRQLVRHLRVAESMDFGGEARLLLRPIEVRHLSVIAGVSLRADPHLERLGLGVRPPHGPGREEDRGEAEQAGTGAADGASHLLLISVMERSAAPITLQAGSALACLDSSANCASSRSRSSAYAIPTTARTCPPTSWTGR